MNKFTFKPFAFLFSAAMCLGISACGDDNKDNDEPVDPTAIKAIEMEYTTDITPDYLTYYDITVTHGADSNDGVTSDIYTDGWLYSQSFDKGIVELPKKLFCKIIATPKNPVPEHDDATVYRFGSSSTAIVTGVRNDNSTTLFTSPLPNEHSISIPGNKLTEFLNRGERIIMNFSTDLKY